VIGLAGQYAAVDENLTGLENLTMVGRLYGNSRGAAKARGRVLLERFDLMDAANRPTKTYSGGMRRRLDLGASLVGAPQLLLLDEPTTGLDPRSRIGMWEIIRELVRDGTTLLLTTQYLDEADELANQIVVIDHGKVIAAGTAPQLKNRIGGEVLGFTVPDRARLAAAATAMADLGPHDPQVDEESGRVTVGVGEEGSRLLIDAVRRLDSANIDTVDLALRRPSLDDVFLALTGHAAEEEEAADAKQAKGRRGRRRSSEQVRSSPDGNHRP
jgi:ABC-2 type transport system ATP-binding protein